MAKRWIQSNFLGASNFLYSLMFVENDSATQQYDSSHSEISLANRWRLSNSNARAGNNVSFNDLHYKVQWSALRGSAPFFVTAVQTAGPELTQGTETRAEFPKRDVWLYVALLYSPGLRGQESPAFVSLFPKYPVSGPCPERPTNSVI